MLVTVLAGGVGAARFLDGLVRVVHPGDVTVIGNVGDDLEILGLHVSPDLDTVLYTLAGLVEPVRGWGRSGDTASALAVVSQLGGEDWFFLSDGDIGLHLVRTERLRRGEPLSAIMRDVCERLGVGVTLLPVTDDTLRTLVTTDDGEVDFQTYFVRRRHEDDVRAVRYAGAEDVRPAPGVIEAIGAADVVVVAPSNPFLSVEAILAVPGVRAALRRRAGSVVGVSPIVAGRAIKGPADRMLRTLVGDASPVAVAERYADFLTHMLVDSADHGSVAAIERLGIHAGTAETLMIDPARRPGVARAALDLAADMLA
jgi:LPPG:FO 2-phospho-L-lactate transferase